MVEGPKYGGGSGRGQWYSREFPGAKFCNLFFSSSLQDQLKVRQFGRNQFLGFLAWLTRRWISARFSVQSSNWETYFRRLVWVCMIGRPLILLISGNPHWFTNHEKEEIISGFNHSPFETNQQGCQSSNLQCQSKTNFMHYYAIVSYHSWIWRLFGRESVFLNEWWKTYLWRELGDCHLVVLATLSFQRACAQASNNINQENLFDHMADDAKTELKEMNCAVEGGGDLRHLRVTLKNNDAQWHPTSRDAPSSSCVQDMRLSLLIRIGPFSS